MRKLDANFWTNDQLSFQNTSNEKMTTQDPLDENSLKYYTWALEKSNVKGLLHYYSFIFSYNLLSFVFKMYYK